MTKQKLGSEILYAADQMRRKAVNAEFARLFQPQKYKEAKEEFKAQWQALKLLCKEANRMTHNEHHG